MNAGTAPSAASLGPLPNWPLEAWAPFAGEGLRLFEQCLERQLAWFAQTCAWQRAWLEVLAPGAAWPSWMVWQNGTEQLA
jgi:hypothetical protein